jgi:RNA polymerase sigma-70 factor (ECF subfamily)
VSTTGKEASIEDLIEALRAAPQENASPYCEEIIRRFEPLLRKAWRHLPRTAEYSDFVQDVFVRLFGSLPKLRDPRAFPGYFQRVVQSTVASAVRRKEPPSESLDDTHSRKLASRLDRDILAAVFLQSYLHLLTPRERSVLQMEWVDELPPDEIRAALGLSRGGLSAAKSRAVNKLREIITHEAARLEADGVRE